MAGKIFVNYRRGEDQALAGRLFDRLGEAFGREQLFMDVDSIAPGLDFEQVLKERLGQCDIVLTVIGKGWLDARPRLDDPQDFVRIEIETSLNQEKRVIPVLVDEARMPRADELGSDPTAGQTQRCATNPRAVPRRYTGLNQDTPGDAQRGSPS